MQERHVERTISQELIGDSVLLCSEDIAERCHRAQSPSMCVAVGARSKSIIFGDFARERTLQLETSISTAITRGWPLRRDSNGSTRKAHDGLEHHALVRSSVLA